MPTSQVPFTIHRLGRRDYEPVWREMQAFNAARTVHTPDEIWRVEHSPVFTVGLNGKPEHLLAPGDIPVVETDRGGQVTYHGPGQVVIYPLLDIRRLGLGVRELVSRLERAVIDLLAGHGIQARARRDAPGVYVDDAKVAALGLRVRRQGCYHGLSLNVDMDLEPFSRINPCGYRGLAVTQLRDLGVNLTPDQAGEALLGHLAEHLQARSSTPAPFRSPGWSG